MKLTARRALGIGLALVILAAAAVLFRARIAQKMPDLAVYWTAAVRARGAEPLYRIEDQHYQFKYLPAFAVLAIPLGLVPLPSAKALWFVVSLGLLAILIQFSRKLLPEQRRATWLLVTATLVVMGKFYAHELVLGQMNVLFAVVAVLALLALRRGAEARGGLFVAAAIAVKPYAVIFLPWLLARRHLSSIAGATVGLLAVLALPVALYGVDGTVAQHLAWWRTVTDSTAPNLTNPDNISLAAFFAKWIGAGRLAAALAGAAGLALLAAAAFVIARRDRAKRPDALDGALLLTLIPMLSPQGWDYVFLVATPAVMLLVNYLDRLPLVMRAVTGVALAAIGLSLYDVMGRAHYRAFMDWSIITVCFVVVVTSLVTLRLRRAA